VVMSLKRIPGFGKSGTSRILLARSSVRTGTTQRVVERTRSALLVLALVGLAGCNVQIPQPGGSVSLPNEFPADFPIPPSSKLVLASGPLPFLPPQARVMTAQWSSTLTRAELESFYGKSHAAWKITGAPITGPSAGPVSLGTLFIFTHDGDGLGATVSVGASNVIDSGILVQATIIPARPLPSSPPP